MARYISCATTVLMDPKTAPAEIDRCFSTMLMESRPVYIGVPVDMSHLMCDGSALKTPLERSLPPNVPTKEQGMVQSLRSLLETKKSPIFIVDGNAVRNNWQDECSKLSKLTGLPTFTTVMGKGATDEDAPSFGGVYTGAGTPDEVRKAIESTDCVFWIGNFPVSTSNDRRGSILILNRAISIPESLRIMYPPKLPSIFRDSSSR